MTLLRTFFTFTFGLFSLGLLAQAGAIDPSFDIGSGADDRVRNITLQPDGRIIIAGDFTEYNLAGYEHLARLLPDGGFDVSFFTNSANQAIYTTELQADGKVLLGGVFSNYQGPRLRIARVDDEADLDPSFDPGTGASGVVRDFEVLPDGKILVAGNLVTYNDTEVNRIARLNPDGTLDLNFDAGTGFNGNTYSLAIQEDGKIVVGGFFISLNGESANRIVRLNPDGSRDNLFDTGTGADAVVRRVALQSDGKILIAGGFESFNGSPVNFITRLNADGSMDDTFNIGSGPNDDIYALAVQADGKILIGGEFTSFDGTTTNRIARLNTNGSLDTGFNTGTGLNGRVEDIAIQADGKVLVGGDFTSFNGSSQNGLVRLFGDATDCNGDENGTAFLDECGTCVGGNTGLEACVADCNSDFGGTAFLDECETCVGGNTGLDACEQDCNGDFGGTAFLDECETCVGGNTGLDACEQDCNGDFGGTAFLDECETCVGGNTGLDACEQDCNGDFGGTAFLDECETCVGGNTGLDACEQDCNGDFGGTAFIDECDTCVGGNTGLEACVADCNGNFGGTAFLDECETCVGGNTGLDACEQDCNGDFGGTAFLDECETCVGGNTGLDACEQDCNGDFGGTAFLDECDTCVGGNTGLEACVADCNGDFGGTAFLDECETCVGGNTGLDACEQDCNGDFGGTAFIDECDTCVGGNTGLEACVADCNGDFGGTAFLDECETCVGGNTGLEPCTGGCIDDTACNYDVLAGFDDGSCFFVGDTCDDDNSETINDVIQPNCECEGELPSKIEEIEERFLIYPNPASFSIKVAGGLSSPPFHFKIMDTKGSILMSSVLTDSDEIDISNLAPGIYILELNNAFKQHRARVVISR
jgi:uncharacterized delta-60 repeat protein